MVSDAMVAFEIFKKPRVIPLDVILMEVEESFSKSNSNQTKAANYFTKSAETLENARYMESK